MLPPLRTSTGSEPVARSIASRASAARAAPGRRPPAARGRSGVIVSSAPAGAASRISCSAVSRICSASWPGASRIEMIARALPSRIVRGFAASPVAMPLMSKLGSASCGRRSRWPRRR